MKTKIKKKNTFIFKCLKYNIYIPYIFKDIWIWCYKNMHNMRWVKNYNNNENKKCLERVQNYI